MMDHENIPEREAPLEEEEEEQVVAEPPRMKVVGLGGAGRNAVCRLKGARLGKIDFAVADTDIQGLEEVKVRERLVLGRAKTRGFSTGGNLALGREVGDAERDIFERMVEGVEILFIVAGLGGGTGSGAAPVLADVAADSGALVIAFVSMPFSTEGETRRDVAKEALCDLQQNCHAVIPLNNDLMAQEVAAFSYLLDALDKANEWIVKGMRAVHDLLLRPGLINLDYGSLRQALSERGGRTLYGFGRGKGDEPLNAALEDLLQCPLLHTPQAPRRADSLLVNIVGGSDLVIDKVRDLMTRLPRHFGGKATVTFGLAIDEKLNGKVQLVVIGKSEVQPSAEPRADGSGEERRNGGRPQPRALMAEEYQDPDWVKDSDYGEQPKEATSRSYFKETERNYYDGEDLDVPTFMRRGVRVRIRA